MEGSKNINDSLNEVKIHKPKAVRLCPRSKKSSKSSLSSSTSTVNSEVNMNQFNGEETKIDLENISIEEINTDFFIYGQCLEEQECQNELYEIMNNSYKNDIPDDEENINEPKIKRCKNELKEDPEILKSSYFDDIFDEINNLYSIKVEEEEEE